MKKISHLPILLLCALLLAGCGDSGGGPTPNAATFRVDIQQRGDYAKFAKIISIHGGEFYRTGTEERMPVVLFEEHLTEESYSYEAEGVRELNIQTTYGFSAVETPPAAMELEVTVYQNGKQVGRKIYAYTHETNEANEFLRYQANQ